MDEYVGEANSADRVAAGDIAYIQYLHYVPPDRSHSAGVVRVSAHREGQALSQSKIILHERINIFAWCIVHTDVREPSILTGTIRSYLHDIHSNKGSLSN